MEHLAEMSPFMVLLTLVWSPQRDMYVNLPFQDSRLWLSLSGTSLKWKAKWSKHIFAACGQCLGQLGLLGINNLQVLATQPCSKPLMAWKGDIESRGVLLGWRRLWAGMHSVHAQRRSLLNYFITLQVNILGRKHKLLAAGGGGTSHGFTARIQKDLCLERAAPLPTLPRGAGTQRLLGLTHDDAHINDGLPRLDWTVCLIGLPSPCAINPEIKHRVMLSSACNNELDPRCFWPGPFQWARGSDELRS